MKDWQIWVICILVIAFVGVCGVLCVDAMRQLAIAGKPVDTPTSTLAQGVISGLLGFAAGLLVRRALDPTPKPEKPDAPNDPPSSSS